MLTENEFLAGNCLQDGVWEARLQDAHILYWCRPIGSPYYDAHERVSSIFDAFATARYTLSNAGKTVGECMQQLSPTRLVFGVADIAAVCRRLRTNRVVSRNDMVMDLLDEQARAGGVYSEGTTEEACRRVDWWGQCAAAMGYGLWTFHKGARTKGDKMGQFVRCYGGEEKADA